MKRRNLIKITLTLLGLSLPCFAAKSQELSVDDQSLWEKQDKDGTIWFKKLPKLKNGEGYRSKGRENHFELENGQVLKYGGGGGICFGTRDGMLESFRYLN